MELAKIIIHLGENYGVHGSFHIDNTQLDTIVIVFYPTLMQITIIE